MNTTKNSIPESTNEGIAEEWIRDLRRKNNILSVLFVLTIVVAAVAASFAFQNMSTAQSEQGKLSLIEHDLRSVEEEKGRLLEDNTDLSQRVALLTEQLTQNASENEAQMQADAEKAALAAKIQTALEEKVSVLEAALSESQGELSELEGMLGKREGVSQELAGKLKSYRESNAQLKQKSKRLQEELSSRQTAYQAVVARLKEAKFDLEQLKTKLQELSLLNEALLAQQRVASQAVERSATTDTNSAAGVSSERLTSNAVEQSPLPAEVSSTVPAAPFSIEDARPKNEVVFKAPSNSSRKTIDTANQIVLE